MDTDLTELRWFKSSASSAAGCEWECFLIGAKNGEFDLPVI